MEIGYELEALKRDWPAANLNPRRPYASSNPTLGDFLEYGSLTELANAVMGGFLPEPWLSLAICVIPWNALIFSAFAPNRTR